MGAMNHTLQRYQPRSEARRLAVAMAVGIAVAIAVIAIGAGTGSVATVVNAGHSGAKSVWEEVQSGDGG